MSNNYAIVGGELCHYGVKGMQWGVRRYQNEDGSLTDEGKKRYAEEIISAKSKKDYYFGSRERLREEYELNETPAMKQKRIELKKLIRAEERLWDKIDDVRRTIVPSSKLDGFEKNKERNATIKELQTQTKELRNKQKTFAKAWADEFLGKYANMRAKDVQGVSYSIGKEFAEIFERSAGMMK